MGELKEEEHQKQMAKQKRLYQDELENMKMRYTRQKIDLIDLKMGELKEEHQKQMAEQKRLYQDELESMKRQLEQKSCQEEGVKQPKEVEGAMGGVQDSQIYSQKPREATADQQHHHYPIQAPGSPEGFWPNPDKEFFHKTQTPPWLLPKKRKTKGDTPKYYFDLTDEELKWEQSGEVPTSNRYELLNQEDTPTRPSCREGTTISRKKNKSPDFSSRFGFKDYMTCTTQDSVNYDGDYVNCNSDNKFITQESVMNSSFENFMTNKAKLQNSNNHYMYQNKHNFCSGYMPSFITHDSIDGYEFSKGSNQSHYYLYTNDNMYLKPLTNNAGKYNNVYFDKLRHAYKISKKHRNSILKDTERSIPTVYNLNPDLKDTERSIPVRHISLESERRFNRSDINNNNNNNNNNISNSIKLKGNDNSCRYYRHSNINPGCPERRTPGGLGLNPKDTERSIPIVCSLGESERRFSRSNSGTNTHQHTHRYTNTYTHTQTNTHTQTTHTHTHTQTHTHM